MATSVASSPVASSTRPILGLLCRASNVHQRSLQIRLEPRAEIHRRTATSGTPMSPEVAGGIPRRDVEAAAERNREVLEIAADADALREHVERGARGPRLGVAEGDLRVHPVANRLHPPPASRARRRTSRPRPPTADPPRRSGCPSGIAGLQAADRRPALPSHSGRRGPGRRSPQSRCCCRAASIPAARRTGLPRLPNTSEYSSSLDRRLDLHAVRLL